MDRKLYVSTISSLVDYFEGYGTLAVILNVSVEELTRWAEGKSRPPVDVFLRMVDLSTTLNTAFAVVEGRRQHRSMDSGEPC